VIVKGFGFQGFAPEMMVCSTEAIKKQIKRKAVVGIFSAALTRSWPKAKRYDLLWFFDGRQEE
jgi:hypothetical protein